MTVRQDKATSRGKLTPTPPNYNLRYWQRREIHQSGLIDQLGGDLISDWHYLRSLNSIGRLQPANEATLVQPSHNPIIDQLFDLDVFQLRIARLE